jgi:CRP/FNR family transcriptional regulator, anaerobic regulatory protein
MEMEDILKYLEAIYPLSEASRNYFASTLKLRKVAKKELLLKAGHVCRNIYFIKKGLVRCFYTNKSVEVSSWFMKEGDLIISVESFFQQTPSKENIHVLEDCIVYSMEYAELQYLYRNYLECNYIGRVLTEKYYTLSEQRISALRMPLVSDRYKYLMDNQPELIQRVPSKYIASYLRVTEQSLSRIRGKKIIT